MNRQDEAFVSCVDLLAFNLSKLESRIDEEVTIVRYIPLVASGQIHAEWDGRSM